MPAMFRLATYNVEWFNALFDDNGQLLLDDAPGGRHGVGRARQAAAVAQVLAAIDADAVLVVEAPNEGRRRSTVRALENFAAAFGLRTRSVLMGFASETEQELALLYDPDRVAAVHDPQGPASGRRGQDRAPRFDGVFRIDLNADGQVDHVRFARPPLELVLRPAGGGQALRLIGVHMKSKAPHGARNPEEAHVIALANRRKQLAQCLWLRGRVEDHLAAGDSLIVLGDLNDGPGLDEYENGFGQSGVEVVMGLGAAPALRLHDPNARRALHHPLAAAPTSSRFWLAEEGRYLSALLDYIMVSPDLCARDPRWRIWHPFEDPQCWEDAVLRDALLAASDHFPVTLDLAL